MGRIFRWAGTALVWLAILLCLAITLVPPFLDRHYYQGPESRHYDGQRFFNSDGPNDFQPVSSGNRLAFMWRIVTGRDRQDWPEHIAIKTAHPAPRVMGEAMVATWVGHASMLVQTQGLNILTDPVWSHRAGPFGFGPERVADPGIAFADLPKIDLIIVSHNHYDHMDLATIKRIWDRDRPLIVTSLGNDTLIREAGAEAQARDWGGRVAVKPGIDVIVTRNHHWGTRWGTDQRRALWSSFVVTLSGGNLFFAGDSGFGDGEWPREAARYGPVRLALLPVGAFRFSKGQMASGSHIGPIQSVEVFKRLGAAHAIGIHWGTFQLSYEARDTPPRMLAEVMKCNGLDPKVFDTIGIGASATIPAYAPPAAGHIPLVSCLSGPAITKLP